MRKRSLFVIFCAVALLCFAAATTHVRYRGHREGIFVFRKGTFSFEVSDDVFLGQEHELVAALRFTPLARFFKRTTTPAPRAGSLEYEWDGKRGDGFVRSHFPDGTKLLTYFSRFIDSGGEEPLGLFVGGGSPDRRVRDGRLVMNETGMAFFDGREWRHLWCNANESIGSMRHVDAPIAPSSWQFLGSRVLRSTAGELVLRSDHRVDLDGVPVRIDRFAFFRAGQRYFTLVIRLRNEGSAAARYFYLYGDEPWVGNFGTSVGNVGWVRDHLVYYEGSVDTGKYSFAGLYDDGNPVIAEKRDQLTGLSNFISWGYGIRPDLVYFSNEVGKFSETTLKVPLSSANNRVITLSWGPKTLDPGQTSFLVLAIGMGEAVPPGQVPVKPRIAFPIADFHLVTQSP